jgi:hypothetical protein
MVIPWAGCGGWEANTITLIEEYIAHLSATPGDVLPPITLVLIQR